MHNALGNYLGLLDPRTSKAISNLAEKYFVHVEAYTCLKEPDPNIHQATISINIYGLSENIDEVGDILFESSIFLQRPLKRNSKVEYKNPQSFDIPKVVPVRFCSANHGTKCQRLYDMKDDLMDSLATATKGMRFQDCPVSTRLKTQLLEYTQFFFPCYFQLPHDDLSNISTL